MTIRKATCSVVFAVVSLNRRDLFSSIEYCSVWHEQDEPTTRACPIHASTLVDRVVHGLRSQLQPPLCFTLHRQPYIFLFFKLQYFGIITTLKEHYKAWSLFRNISPPFVSSTTNVWKFTYTTNTAMTHYHRWSPQFCLSSFLLTPPNKAFKRYSDDTSPCKSKSRHDCGRELQLFFKTRLTDAGDSVVSTMSRQLYSVRRWSSR